MEIYGVGMLSNAIKGTNGMEKVNWQRTRDILVSIICIGIIAWFAWGLLLGQFVHALVLLLLSMAVAFLLTHFFLAAEQGFWTAAG